MTSETEYVLGAAQAADPAMLVPPAERKLGGGEPEIKHGGITIRVGNRPIVRDLRRLYEKGHREVPPDLDVFDCYNIWLITFTFSIIPTTWIREVIRVGFEVVFPESPRISILSTLPDTRFVERLKGTLSGKVDLEVNGKAATPAKTESALNLAESLPFGGKVEISSEAKFAARLTLAVITPTIMAIGEADTRAEWAFLKEEAQLAGNQEMVMTLLVPRHTKKLKPTLRVTANIATFSFLPARLAGPPLEVECILPEDRK